MCRRLPGVVLGLLLATGAAWAQSAPADPAVLPAPPVATPSQVPPPQGAPAPAPPAPVVERTEHGTPAIVLSLEESDGVIGKAVRSAVGEDMGRIIDVVVSVNSQVRAAVIDFGGFLGVGTRKVAVDWRALQFATDGKTWRVTATLTRNQVRASPEYKVGEPIVVLGAPQPSAPAPQPSAPAPQSSAAPAPPRNGGTEPAPAAAAPGAPAGPQAAAP